MNGLLSSAKYYPSSRDCQVVGTDCVTQDKIPFIGEYSMFSPNMYVATGFRMGNDWVDGGGDNYIVTDFR